MGMTAEAMSPEVDEFILLWGAVFSEVMFCIVIG